MEENGPPLDYERLAQPTPDDIDEAGSYFMLYTAGVIVGTMLVLAVILGIAYGLIESLHR